LLRIFARRCDALQAMGPSNRDREIHA
jgi:hypothetical protein